MDWTGGLTLKVIFLRFYSAKQPDFSERGHHYTILAYYTAMLKPRSQAFTQKIQYFQASAWERGYVMLKCIQVSNLSNTQFSVCYFLFRSQASSALLISVPSR